MKWNTVIPNGMVVLLICAVLYWGLNRFELNRSKKTLPVKTGVVTCTHPDYEYVSFTHYLYDGETFSFMIWYDRVAHKQVYLECEEVLR